MVMSSRQRLDSHSDDMIGLSFAVAFLGLTMQFLFDEGSFHAHWLANCLAIDGTDAFLLDYMLHVLSIRSNCSTVLI